MTTYYVDPENGNDSNAGTSFALRRKTWSSSLASSSDNIRLMASIAPISLGNATWTDNSATVTLATAVTSVVDACDTAWTASTNVTCTTQTTGATPQVWKEGAACTRMAVASAFTTGIVAYHALGSTLDLSAYTAISLRIGANLGIAAGVLRLDLCSDAVGAVPVTSFILPALTASLGAAVFVDNVTALPNNVQSITIYALSDPSFPSIDIDNIIACQSRTSSTHLCHDSLLGKMTSGEPEWYSIKSIVGTTVILGDRTSTPSTMNRLYRGVSETVPTYCNIPTRAPAYAVITNFVAQDNISGGWDRTSMSSQIGDTYLTGWGTVTTAFGANSGSNLNISNVSPVAFGTAAFAGQTITEVQHVLQGAQAIDNALIMSNVYTELTATFGYCIMNTAFAAGFSFDVNSQRWKVAITKWKMSAQANGGFFVTSSTAESSHTDGAQTDIRIGEISNNLVGWGAGSIGTVCMLKGCTFALNTSDFPTAASFGGTIALDTCSGFTNMVSGTTWPGVFIYTNKGGNPQHGWIRTNTTVLTQNAVLPPTGDVWAWSIFGGPATTLSTYPVTKVISRLKVTSGHLYSFSVDGMVSATSTTGVFIVKDPVTGNELTRITIIGTAGSWSTYTTSFTAASTGVVELHFGRYGTSASTLAYMANLVITGV